MRTQSTRPIQKQKTTIKTKPEKHQKETRTPNERQREKVNNEHSRACDRHKILVCRRLLNLNLCCPSEFPTHLGQFIAPLSHVRAERP